jgi:uncharacterized protein
VEKTAYEAGAPSWVDLGTPDPRAAAGFYSRLFGWEVKDLGEESGGYQMAEIGGVPVAGLGPQMNHGVPPYWTTYIATDDAEATSARVKAAGGRVLAEPFDVFDSGRMAVFADPTGAPFSTWQAGVHTGSGYVDQPGSMSWHELYTREPATAMSFYSAVFGWEPAEEDMDGSTYTLWKLGDAAVGGMIAMDGNSPAEVPAHWLVYFAVDDCDASVTRVDELGGSVIMPPMDVPPGRFAIVSDPNGAMFAVIQLTEGATVGD